ncbi:MarR family winged helix-turn-helix transcriptional regulator [Microbacterium sp. CIAB417]|uniref:MarR family winged helix-turn-helix transcriptional regulator n=1 Tax=Microbacterium sp. CIAB417 TaxID=2860287 RepID=UPI001FACED20|nr:helix-turn-helix domain-containing protein [Microbacterium sp. CIAB417]
MAAYDPRILLFGRLLAAANGFEYLLAKELAEATGLTHPILEPLLIVARAGDEGTSVKDIAQARVVTSGGATRLVSRAVEQGLVERQGSAGDRAGFLSGRPRAEPAGVTRPARHALTRILPRETASPARDHG